MRGPNEGNTSDLAEVLMEEQKDWMGWKHPDDMTPEERLDEILDIIARGAVRLATILGASGIVAGTVAAWRWITR